MKYNNPEIIILVLSIGLLLIVSTYPIPVIADPLENNSKVTLIVNYANHTAKTYSILADKYQKHTIYQSNSWFNNNTRFNLQAYSIDNSPHVKVPRSSNGNFTLNVPTDSDHSIVFMGKPQFKINVIGTNSTIFAPPSPTGDNWFDEDTDVKVIVPYVIASDQENSRQQLNGWSTDDSYINVISRQESGNFKSPAIHITGTYTINFEYITQYYIKVISEFGRSSGTGWHDSGTIINIGIIPNNDILTSHVFTGWQGPIIGTANEDSASVFIDSPKVLVATWHTDYTIVSIIVVMVIGVVVSLVIYKKRKT